MTVVPEDWERVESVVEYETGWYTGGYDLLRQPDGTEKRYYWAELPPATVAVVREGDHLMMVQQYRPPIREYCLELPAGIVEDVDVPGDGAVEPQASVPPEAYENAAAREVREETGYDPGAVHFLEDVWVSTGVLRHRRGLVFATDLEPAQRALDTNEFIEVTRVPVADVFERVRVDPANDATLEGVLLAERAGLLD
ncbi:NUDIX hydrolase [Halomarina ordinaria]|uniref:NUDIX hydrolase n=1 Tax=Halomarina ordinaria TaxID=3033939 RepID=A0ABD5U8M3_9EURY|nr:NUDIX hydrolase [Halomarina sp. PSRA2]